MPIRIRSLLRRKSERRETIRRGTVRRENVRQRDRGSTNNQSAKKDFENLFSKMTKIRDAQRSKRKKYVSL